MDQIKFFITAEYASNSYVFRRHLWNELTNLQQSNPIHWCMLGDFNAIIDFHEKFCRCTQIKLPLMIFLVRQIKTSLCILTLMVAIKFGSMGGNVVLTFLLGFTEPFVIRIG